jgi:hypothetical protein
MVFGAEGQPTSGPGAGPALFLPLLAEWRGRACRVGPGGVGPAHFPKVGWPLLGTRFAVLQALDSWVHRRLRAVLWKQWRTSRRRFAELRQRNVSRDLAAQTVGSCHGPWRLSKSPALHYALPTLYFQSLGLPILARQAA